jgi:hypothetical protein
MARLAGAAVLTVTNCTDTTPGGVAGELRNAISDAHRFDTIEVPPCQITLTGTSEDNAT